LREEDKEQMRLLSRVWRQLEMYATPWQYILWERDLKATVDLCLQSSVGSFNLGFISSGAEMCEQHTNRLT
jgi:hypothetical protein